MGVPSVQFLKYSDAGSAEFTTMQPGDVYTTDLVTAGAYSQAAAMRVKVVSDSVFHLTSLKIWANDTMATINNGTQDLGDGYTTVAPATPTWWSMVFIYTSGDDTEAVDDAVIQTSVLTCPAEVFTNGSATWTMLPADFRGNTKNDGLDLLSGVSGGIDGALSGSQYVAYTKPMGISFKPNVSSQYGHYTDFSVRIEFSFV